MNTVSNKYGKKFLSVFSGAGKRNDIVMAVLIVAIIFMMILPMPTELVDFLIAINMGGAVILLMLAIYIHGPLEFSAFPSVLLLTTLFRLALSITTTRLILLQADAGQIIYTFGNFVVGGNLIVGAVIFLIITVVQFIVITKGSERVAEVSARFSLDAMPGKQMSIDGDMRAGAIDMDEARLRRARVEKESQLYGAMDGAMKFVKGDAIAGLIIIVVNILGGVSIGVMQRDMSVQEALQIYSILTIGDGLIAQIPALLIAITAGFIVTRVTTDESEDLGKDIGTQVMIQPKALLIGGALLFLFALIPGFPTIVFLILAAIVGGGGYIKLKEQQRINNEHSDEMSAMAPAAQAPGKQKLTDQEEFALTVPFLIDVAADTQQIIQADQLNSQLLQIRRALYLDLGVPFPGIHLRFNDQMHDGSYAILLHEIPVAEGKLLTTELAVLVSHEQLDILGIEYTEKDIAFPGAQPLWVDVSREDALQKAGIEYMNTTRVLTYHLSFVLKKYAEDFIGIQETQYLINQMEERFSELVKEVQRLLPLQKITEIFQRLVSEDISIRNLRSVLESLAHWGQKEKDTVLLTEYVRGSLSRHISYKYSNGQNILPAHLLDQEMEETIREGVRQTSSGAYLALDPAVTEAFVNRVKEAVGDISRMPHKPVLIVSMDIRRYVRKLIETQLYDLAVLSYQELVKEITIQPLSRISQ